MDLDWDKISLREEGSSLVAVLITITIIFFLIGSVLMAIVMQSRFIQRDIEEVQFRYSAEAGIHHFLADSTLPMVSKKDSLEIKLADSSSATIEVEPFGGFWSVTSTVGSDDRSKTIHTLVGNKASPPFKKAVILGDLHSALNLTGTTTINGGIEVGPLGIKKKSFKGELFKGSVEGSIKKSKSDLLPEFDNSLFKREISYCDSLLKKPPKGAIQLRSGKINLSKENLFKNGSAFFVEGDLELSADSTVNMPEELVLVVTGDLTLKGPISYNPFSRFIAGKDLKMSGKINGRHGLFYAARELLIETNNPFSGQIIAGRKAIISGSSYLEYPTVVYVKGIEKQGKREGRAELTDQSIVEGTLIIPPPGDVINQDETRLVVGKGVVVRGAIFNTGQTELHGKVLGSVLTLQFYFYKSPTSYINWLKDVVINVEKRPENFAIPLGFPDRKRFQILTWEEI